MIACYNTAILVGSTITAWSSKQTSVVPRE
jgi:hypothetical protein